MAEADSLSSPPVLSLDRFQSLLSTTWLGKAHGWTNELWDRLESTNNRAAELATMGAPAGLIVAARQQTAGRGRLGRVWISPADSGLYVSFLLRPGGARTGLPAYTLACGAAAARAIWQCLGVRIGLKWVNDLVLNARKLGGILAEMPSLSGSASADLAAPLILGIGINLRFDPAWIPGELRDRIEWLDRLVAQPVDPNQLLAFLCRSLEQECQALEAGRTADVFDAWRQYSVTLGRTIQAHSGGQVIEGLAVDLSETGGLIVETQDRRRVILHAGEITIRGANGSYV